MQVTSEQTDPCTIVLDIEVEEDQVSRTFDTVYREFSKYANVPGFRPGKAPRSLVERYVNVERVRERAHEKLITDTFTKAIENEGITPYRQPRLETGELKDKEPYAFKAIVPLEPRVELGAYTGITVEKPVFLITDAQVDEMIERIRQGRSRLERVADRGVQDGDVLIVEQKIDIENEESTEPARRQLVQIGQNPPGYDEAVLGMRPEEQREFDLTYPEDYAETDKRGKKAHYTVTLNSLSAKKLPDLNDAFAKQVAAVDTVDEMRAQIKEREEQKAAEISEEITTGRLIEAIVANATIYFPEALQAEQAESDLRNLASELRQNNATYERYLAQLGQTPEQHQRGVAERAANHIRQVLALRAIAEAENIVVSDDEIDGDFERLMNEGELTEDQVSEFSRDKDKRLQLANALTQQRLRDLLYEKNTINEVEQAVPSASETTDDSAPAPDSNESSEEK